MSVQIKICGITTAEAVEAAPGADYIGFIFYSPSPRNITAERAAELAALSALPAVAVTVDAIDAELDHIVQVMRPAFLQLHGKESPSRVQEIRTRWNIPVIKAFSVRTASDILQAEAYTDGADMFMFDAKPSVSTLPGGTGESFDWKLLANFSCPKPWFLSGGLDAHNIKEALQIAHAPMVDVSSRLESSAGIKDPAKVRQFIEICRKMAPG